MSSDSVEEQYNKIVSELGLSEAEALKVLGLEHPPTPPAGQLDITKELRTMFPHIPPPHISEVLSECNNDVDKASEILLNWREVVIQPAAQTKQNKQNKKIRKQERKFNSKLQNSEDDIRLISTTLKIPPPEAAELYADQGFSVNNVLALKRRLVPLVLNTSEETDKQFQKLHATTPDLGEYQYYSVPQLLSEAEAIRKRLYDQNLITKDRAKDPLKRIIVKDSVEKASEMKTKLKLINLALKRNKALQSGSQRVDLHGMTLEEAKVTCQDFLKQLYLNGRTLEIVTGAGNHSTHGYSIIHKWLKSYLPQIEYIRIMETPHSFVVSLD